MLKSNSANLLLFPLGKLFARFLLDKLFKGFLHGLPALQVPKFAVVLKISVEFTDGMCYSDVEKKSTHSKVDASQRLNVLTDTAYPVSQTG